MRVSLYQKPILLSNIDENLSLQSFKNTSKKLVILGLIVLNFTLQ